MSSDLNPDEYVRWESPTGPIFVDVKRTHSMRDVRGTLVTLAHLVIGEPSGRAVCVLVDSRLSYGRLQEELLRLRGLLRPELANRIHFLVNKGGGASHGVTAFSGSLEDVPDDFYAWLGELVVAERLHGQAPQLPARQTVIAALAQLSLNNQPPVTVKHLQESCGVSYPTVAAVLKELAHKGWLESSGERGVRLRHLTVAEWMELARDHAKQRKVHLFTDPTGHSSPAQMVKRLARLKGAGKLPGSVRIGGVLGAFNRFPGLDITAAPRLDLSVEADSRHVAEMLDAGLRAKTRAEQRTALAVHVTRAAFVNDGAESTEGQWAGELECLADLIEMGFSHEATEMAHHMELTNKERRPIT